MSSDTVAESLLDDVEEGLITHHRDGMWFRAGYPIMDLRRASTLDALLRVPEFDRLDHDWVTGFSGVVLTENTRRIRADVRRLRLEDGR